MKSGEKPEDERIVYKSRNNVTWRVAKTEEELQQELEELLEIEREKKRRSKLRKKGSGRKSNRYIIKLNVVGYPKPYYFGGDEIGWTTYECAVQYKNKKSAYKNVELIINHLDLNNQTDRFDSIEILSIPDACQKEWLFAENVLFHSGRMYKEATEESHEEFVQRRKQENESKDEVTCDSCVCNVCGFRNPLMNNFCAKCLMCRQEGKFNNWTDMGCEKFMRTTKKAEKRLV